MHMCTLRVKARGKYCPSPLIRFSYWPAAHRLGHTDRPWAQGYSCPHFPTTRNASMWHHAQCFMWVPGLDHRSSLQHLSSPSRGLFWGPVIFRMLKVKETRKENKFSGYRGRTEYLDISFSPQSSRYKYYTFENRHPHPPHEHAMPHSWQAPSYPSCSLKQASQQPLVVSMKSDRRGIIFLIPAQLWNQSHRATNEYIPQVASSPRPVTIKLAWIFKLMSTNVKAETLRA